MLNRVYALFVRAVQSHTDSTGLVSTNWWLLSTFTQLLPFTSTSLCISISPSLSLHHLPSLPLSVSSSVSPFFPGPLVRLMDDSAGREWQYINYLAASLILIWLPESSGSAEGRLSHTLTWPGSTTTKLFKERNVTTAPASICTCFWHVCRVLVWVEHEMFFCFFLFYLSILLLPGFNLCHINWEKNKGFLLQETLDMIRGLENGWMHA